MQAGGADWQQASGEARLTLGAWAAISGAAFAPGLGRLTKRGIAALSVFAGLRLGYWWDSNEAGSAQPRRGAPRQHLLMKSRFMLLRVLRRLSRQRLARLVPERRRPLREHRRLRAAARRGRS